MIQAEQAEAAQKRIVRIVIAKIPCLVALVPLYLVRDRKESSAPR